MAKQTAAQLIAQEQSIARAAHEQAVQSAISRGEYAGPMPSAPSGQAPAAKPIPEPTSSARPTSSDVKVGTRTVGGQTYDVYQKPSGETFFGGYATGIPEGVTEARVSFAAQPIPSGIKLTYEPAVLPIRKEFQEKYGGQQLPVKKEFIEKYTPKVLKPETFIITGKQAYAEGLISKAESEMPESWVVTSGGIAAARELKGKYPQIEKAALAPEEVPTEIMMEAERAKFRQQARGEELGRMEMKALESEPLIVFAHTWEQGVAAPFVLGFEAATTGIASVIRGKSPIEEIGKRHEEEMASYVQRISTKDFSPTISSVTAGIGSAIIAVGGGGLGKTAAKWAYRGIVGRQVYQTAETPSLEGIIGTGLLLVPPVVTSIKLPKVEIPIEGGTKTIYRGISLEVGRKAQPILGRAEGEFKIGTADISKGYEQARGRYQPESLTETKIFFKSAESLVKKGIISTKEITKPKLGTEIMGLTERTKSAFIQKDIILDVGSFKTERGVLEVLKFAQKQKGEIYGSFAARQQMPGELSRISMDIDIQLKSGLKKTEALTKGLVGKLQKTGEEARVSTATPTLIEIKKGGKWRHGVDIHSIEKSVSSAYEDVVPKAAYGYKYGQPATKIGKQKMMPLSEHGLRKGGSILTVIAKEGEMRFGPEAHRMKDIADFFNVQTALLRSKITGERGLILLKEMKTLYPEEALKGRGPIRIKLWSPMEQKASMAGIIKSASISIPKSVSIELPKFPSISIPSKPPSRPSYRISPGPSGPSISKPSYKYPSRPPSSVPSISLPSVSLSVSIPSGPGPPSPKPYSPSPYSPSLYSPSPSPSPSKPYSPSPYSPSTPEIGKPKTPPSIIYFPLGASMGFGRGRRKKYGLKWLLHPIPELKI